MVDEEKGVQRQLKKPLSEDVHSSSDLSALSDRESLSKSYNEIPTFEFEEWDENARPLLGDEGPTETIDLAALLNKDVSTTGSFNIRGEIWTTTFGKVLQALPIPAFLIDTNYRTLEANQACSKISTEYETVLGAPFSELFEGPAACKKVQSSLEDAFSSRKARVGEAILKIKDRKIWARMTFRSVRIMDDRFLLALIEDLTNERKQLQINERLRQELEQRVEDRTSKLTKANTRLQQEIEQRKRAEEALRENQDRLEAVLEHLPDLLWMKDLDGTLQLVNTAFARARGENSAKEVVGKTDLEVWGPNLAEERLRDDLAVIESRQSRLVEERMADGGMVKWFEIFKTPLIDEDGEIVGIVGSARDITERKRAEQALRDSEEKYRNILETIADGYHEADLSGSLTLVNDVLCDIVGYSREELLGMNYRNLMDETNSQRVFSAYNEVYRTGAPNTGFDFEIVHKDGTKRQISVSISLVRDSENKPSGFRGVFRDVTGHKRLEEQLQQAAKMEAIGRLAGGIAHDFNNLLTVVIGYSNMLMREIPKADSKHKRLASIAGASERAASLTKQLLAFSRKQVLDVKVININDVIAAMEEMLRRLIGEDIELVTVSSSPLGLVRADPSQIEQILLNLAVNARDAMPNGGRLTIETANVILDEGYSRANAGVDPGLYVLCGVSDSGVGMDAETASHVFDPFFTTKEKGVGTGLGLATVYGIVKQHQGHVVVQSQQGLGTTFKIYLPLVEEFLDRSSTTTTNQIQLGGSETILVVEDEETVRTLTCEALELLGYCVLSAQESEQAVLISDGHPGPIHLLLTDVILPKMDGRSLYKELASARPDMKVLYMSGYTDNFIVHHGMLDQGVHFLAKPFNLDALARKVRDVLEGNP